MQQVASMNLTKAVGYGLLRDQVIDAVIEAGRMVSSGFEAG